MKRVDPFRAQDLGNILTYFVDVRQKNAARLPADIATMPMNPWIFAADVCNIAASGPCVVIRVLPKKSVRQACSEKRRRWRVACIAFPVGRSVQNRSWRASL